MESSCGKIYVRQRNTSVLRELNVSSNAEGERYIAARAKARGDRRRFSDCDRPRPYNLKGELLSLFDCCIAFVSAHLDFLESLQGIHT